MIIGIFRRMAGRVKGGDSRRGEALTRFAVCPIRARKGEALRLVTALCRKHPTRPIADFGEPDLDLVEPGGVGGREVETDARIAFEESKIGCCFESNRHGALSPYAALDGDVWPRTS